MTDLANLDMDWTVSNADFAGNLSSTMAPMPWTQDGEAPTTPAEDYHTATDASTPGDYFRLYSLPIVIAVGCVCNLISFAVFTGTSLRKTSSGVYYASLSISDTVYLATELARWLSTKPLNLPVLSASLNFCKFMYHVRYASLLYSAVLVTTVTIERYIAVVHPLKIATIARVRSARILVVVEAALCILAGTYGSVIFELIPAGPRTICLLTRANTIPYRMSNLVITKIVGEIVTSVVVTACTGAIITSLVRSRKERSRMGTVGGGNGDATTTTGKAASASKMSSTDSQLTMTLVGVATAFVLLRAPFTICWYVNHYLGSSVSQQLAEGLRDASKFTYVISTVNYSINFFLYSLTGSKFRGHLRAMCSLGRGDKKSKSGKYLSSGTGSYSGATMSTSGAESKY